jgi:hypothetical protein
MSAATPKVYHDLARAACIFPYVHYKYVFPRLQSFLSSICVGRCCRPSKHGECHQGGRNVQGGGRKGTMEVGRPGIGVVRRCDHGHRRHAICLMLSAIFMAMHGHEGLEALTRMHRAIARLGRSLLPALADAEKTGDPFTRQSMQGLQRYCKSPKSANILRRSLCQQPRC